MPTEEKPEVCCPMMAQMREHFPLVPLVFPLLFPILPVICALVYLCRTAAGVERIERRLTDILDTVRRIG